MNTTTPYKIFGDSIEQDALDQFETCLNMEGCVQGALMPDSHLGYTAPIGSVLKFKDKISPQLVGYDIGCGVACMLLNVNYKEVDLNRLRDFITTNIPLGRCVHEQDQDTTALNLTGTSDKLRDIFSLKGKKQLGTLGGGNHFIEVGYTQSNGNIAIIIHSGSRGFGHSIASYYMQEAASNDLRFKWPTIMQSHIDDFTKRNSGFAEYNPQKFTIAMDKYVAKQKDILFKANNIEGTYSLDLNSSIGRQYLIDQNFCLEYALQNRRAMINSIMAGIEEQGIDTSIVQFINRNHNHAEFKDGYVIHRKGATHAEAGMYGVIPGNMRDGSFIVQGKGNLDSLCSSSHGAGRVLSRKQAKATLDLNEFQEETAKLVTNHTSEMIDEAPKAYKDIFEVMDAQSELVDIIDRVIPVLNIKG